MQTVLVGLVVFVASCVGPDAAEPVPDGAMPEPAPNVDTTVFTTGEDPANPFFASLGTNDRSCASCHDAAAGWSVNPRVLAARFDATSGLDPVFRSIDGATSPGADCSTPEARRAAYSLLLTRGLFRVDRAVPAAAEFEVIAVDDPYAHATATDLSLYRRPLPSTNTRFEQTLMWDGREPTLAHQAIDATMGHAEAMAEPAADQVSAIVAFESSIYTAQAVDPIAGALDDGANGGPSFLVDQAIGKGPFTIYDAWLNDAEMRRAAIARGEQVFNKRPIQIRGATGIPDQMGSCSTCHDTANVGTSATGRMVNLGLGIPQRRAPTMPLYTLRNTTDGRTIQTTDPGLAMTTGRWDDIGRFKVPALRALALRPPYFHDGSAPMLPDVIGFYDRRFQLRLSPRERDDLLAFLQAL